MVTSVDEADPNVLVMTDNHVDNTRTAASENSNNPPVKRNRTQLSCTYCRQGKLKCDRERPCSQCVKKGRASKCTFLPPAARKRPAAGMQNRLNHLESLVKEAMASQPSNEFDKFASNSHTPEIDPSPQLQTLIEIPGTFVEPRRSAHDDVSNASGQVVQGPNETTYVGATHWAAMLDDARFRVVLLT